MYAFYQPKMAKTGQKLTEIAQNNYFQNKLMTLRVKGFK